MSLLATLSSCWQRFQADLFPELREVVGPLSERQERFVMVLDLARVEALTPHWHGLPGRPPAERAALARAFVAKAVFDVPTTSLLVDRLKVDKTLRRLCGWERAQAVPSEATFSRAFAEFAASALPMRLHETLIGWWDIFPVTPPRSRHGKSPVTVAAPEKPKGKRGRPRKGEEPPVKEVRRIERQVGQSLEAMLADLPKRCARGVKRNAKGYTETWTGYKLHLDVADGGIPISCVLTAASVHDSQVAIPLATMTAARVTSLYDVMDSAYDDPMIRSHSQSLGHVPLIDVNPRANKELKQELEAEAKRRQLLGHKLAEEVRYNERTTAERANARIKDEFGGRNVRVRGNAKVMCHLMFGTLVLTIDQLLRFVT